MKKLFLLFPLVLVTACSSEPEPVADTAPDSSTAATPTPYASAEAPAAASAVDEKTLTLAGLGDLRIGESVPSNSSWGERGAQEPNSCRTVSSADYPGIYAIVEEGKVRRISLGQRSDVKLIEGIGVGSAEKDVRASFAGFREDAHKYVEAPAKYLTAPNAASGDPALRFEIGRDGKVSQIHVGTMPQLGYVEGCS